MFVSITWYEYILEQKFYENITILTVLIFYLASIYQVETFKEQTIKVSVTQFRLSCFYFNSQNKERKLESKLQENVFITRPRPRPVRANLNLGNFT